MSLLYLYRIIVKICIMLLPFWSYSKSKPNNTSYLLYFVFLSIVVLFSFVLLLYKCSFMFAYLVPVLNIVALCETFPYFSRIRFQYCVHNIHPTTNRFSACIYCQYLTVQPPVCENFWKSPNMHGLGHKVTYL